MSALDLFDSHCHLDDPVFDGDRSDVLASATEAGVKDIVLPGVRPLLFDRLWRTAALGGRLGAPRIHVVLGVHPQVVPELEPLEKALLPRLDAEIAARRPVAIGECGLDSRIAQPEEQELWFRTQIRAARNLQLPLILHIFRTHEPALKILQQEGAHAVGGIVHSFSGSAQLVSRYLDLGFALSFAGGVTWHRARKPVLAAAQVPDAWLLAETDAPDQSPEAIRGQRNEPARVADVVAGLAAARGQTPEVVARLTAANARRLFKLEPAAW